MCRRLIGIGFDGLLQSRLRFVVFVLPVTQNAEIIAGRRVAAIYGVGFGQKFVGFGEVAFLIIKNAERREDFR